MTNIHTYGGKVVKRITALLAAAAVTMTAFITPATASPAPKTATVQAPCQGVTYAPYPTAPWLTICIPFCPAYLQPLPTVPWLKVCAYHGRFYLIP